ncbi:MAG: 3-methyl-2-oxobutanoate hydroxymethyltransferase [Alphaproteobacteria bacterium RIFCSPLOWO2_01_FULL_40_26]|nr:MAG: 3-methyl-2-oxobutanoate hydroxymethyltransferase [Alphaproteobacteria bacterium RIFCSPHIGHO2_02_FULL_40_34]OFW88100.1 MAG: 3-methyl-2-oxobutanoate hydroxymethyltransferase [Alphaproteobacteria bacterium RIFCSPHIGHO2_01_FULL_40_8]OFW95021.1 MAG: 3-methyl-2-oxobutanoate hydroxymethyltransferase [Alphaproteobacteria bacterium RIFCSPLOWO2_01_FULL_40_26]OFX10531.1 MAG: 3-methyl-2-oxobutanoate hydroxymethyltransferase [Alphaproteobacteria bacterium RIFCSPLOWO2_02_FULL_40_19]OFX12104.1 MAG: 3-
MIEKILQKKGQEKIICLTSYSFPITKILDEFCDIILVGDSLGMTIYGMPDTIDVTLSMMINHGKAVAKAAKKSLVVVDLPYGTYEKSKEQALISAKKIISETGCDAIKIETSGDLVATVKFLTDNKINVMGHVGLLPQHVRKIGGYRYQGRDKNSAKEILATAKLVAKAGAFALVIEAVPAELAAKITNEISIPTIGIGASAECDGQVLVIDDLLGLNQEFKPKFVTHYENLAEKISTAVKKFSTDVKAKKFPSRENML